MSKFEPYQSHTRLGGPQRLYRFDNGYGASVVNNTFSYGTELAVIKWDGNDYHLVYDTPVTNDVMGHLSEADVEKALERISNLTHDGQDPVPSAAV